MKTEKWNYGSHNRGTAVYILVWCLISSIFMHCSGHVSVSLSQIVQSNMIEIHQQCPAFASFFTFPCWTAFSIPWNLSKVSCLWETLSDSIKPKFLGHLRLSRIHRFITPALRLPSSSLFLSLVFESISFSEMAFMPEGWWCWRNNQWMNGGNINKNTS